MPKRTILVVEDEPLVRLVAADTLRDEGYEVVEFATADEASEYCRNTGVAFDAVLTDFNMPGRLNGLDLAELLIAAHPAILVVVTSGRRFVVPAELPARVRFLPKPWDLPALRWALREVIDGHP